MNIIINGGSSGIGREAALLFAADRNNRIVVTGRNEERIRFTKFSTGLTYY